MGDLEINTQSKSTKNTQKIDVEDRRKLKLMGAIAESLFTRAYIDYGWVVLKLSRPHITSTGNVISRVDYHKIKMIMKETFDSTRFQKEYDKLFKILTEIKNNQFQLPDFILFQRNKVIFYEVKSYGKKKRSMLKIQSRGIEELRKAGYKVYIKEYKIDMENLSPYLTNVAQEVIRNSDKFRESKNEKKEIWSKKLEIEKELDELISSIEENLDYSSDKIEFSQILEEVKNDKGYYLNNSSFMESLRGLRNSLLEIKTATNEIDKLNLEMKIGQEKEQLISDKMEWAKLKRIENIYTSLVLITIGIGVILTISSFSGLWLTLGLSIGVIIMIILLFTILEKIFLNKNREIRLNVLREKFET